MPTGYTSKLYEGEEQTFEEFLLTCARAFSHIELRDNPPAFTELIGGYLLTHIEAASKELA